MADQIQVHVLRTVLVSDDGIRTREIIAGTDDTVPAGTFDGLEAEGYVTAANVATPPTPPAVADQPAVNWDDLQAMKVAELVALAGERMIVLGEARKKSEIIEAIVSAAATRAG